MVGDRVYERMAVVFVAQDTEIDAYAFAVVARC